MLLLTTFLWVAVPAAAIASAVFMGIFDAAKTEIGLEHYAEKPLESIPWLMPFNTAINFGYVVIGLYWIKFSYKNLPAREQFYFYIFGWSSFLYGPAQLMRFLTQSHHWAIIDQYYTLPIFAWVIPWALHYIQGCSKLTAFLIEVISILSYTLTLVSPIGFEIALVVHILVACSIGINCYMKYQSEDTLNAMLLALISCSGFVALKVLDLHLPAVNTIFEHVSGHFLSKICDCMQIHFVLQFCYSVYVKQSAKLK